MGGTEDKETYVWEDLSAARFEDGAALGFKKIKTQGALYEYAIAGTIHLDHLADLQHSPANQVLLDRQVFQLSRSLDLSEQETRQKLERLLTQHAKEWRTLCRVPGFTLVCGAVGFGGTVIWLWWN